MTHVCHAVHASALPTDVLKWPSGQLEQTRSLLAVAGLLMSSPAEQSLRTEAHATVPSVAENDTPAAHGVHERSAVAVPTEVMPLPIAHVLHWVQAWAPDSALKKPEAHGMQTRSDDPVGVPISYWPAWHSSLTDSHSSSPEVAENVDPVMHTSHSLSIIALPLALWPCPAGQTDIVVHALFPDAILKVPSAQVWQMRSEEAVAARLMNRPGPHGALTSSQAPAPRSVE